MFDQKTIILYINKYKKLEEEGVITKEEAWNSLIAIINVKEDSKTEVKCSENQLTGLNYWY